MPKAAESGATGRRAAFGNAVVTALQMRGFSQRQVADGLGVAQSTISGWISGENEPLPATVFKAERYLKLPAGYLSHHLGYVPTGVVYRTGVEDAIQEDPDLSPTMRHALTVSYRAMITHEPPTSKKKGR